VNILSLGLFTLAQAADAKTQPPPKAGWQHFLSQASHQIDFVFHFSNCSDF
jgi:hypothetical protein